MLHPYDNCNVFPTCNLRQSGHEAEQLAEVIWLEQKQHGYFVPAWPWREISSELSKARH